jgi:hypothetical protein
MIRLRSGVVIALLVSAATTGIASAAKPKPLCHLVVGLKGGQPSVFGPGSVPSELPLPYGALPLYDAALDLRSADVANNAKTVTVVFRLAKLGGGDTTAPAGRFYNFSWVWASSGVAQNIAARITPTGNTFSDNATGVVDLAKNEIRVNQPIDGMLGHPLFAKGEKMTQLEVETDLANPALFVPTTFTALGDRATSKKVYPVGAPSCVKVGV